MKITVNKSIPDLTEEEIKELKERDLPDFKDDPEGFKKAMLGAKEVVISPQVEAQLKEMGVTIDEIVAAMLKEAGASN